MPTGKVSRYPSFLRASLLAALCCLFAMPSGSQVQVPNPAPSKAAVGTSDSISPSVSGKELSAADLETFLDGFMPLQLAREDVAGAVIAVVKDGKLLFAKGYGYADKEKKIRVSPENTLFRPGSVSKLFTWTAVMQQVEQGKLDLDRDVNEYIDFKIPPAFGKPITLRDIMTHRTGFEETIKTLFVASDKDLVPIGQYLRAHLPARIFPPGETPAYSNYGATLAGYIVERVSGQPIADYIDEHIFKPLAMTNATIRQPLPESLKPLMSNGYQLGSGEAKPFEYVEAAPAGSGSASAEAMTHFMIAHLQTGHFGDVQILKPETAILMHSRQQGWPAAMNAMALGFYEESRNGHRIIGHAGDTQWFHTDLHLILDSNVGFFVSYNSLGGAEVSPRTSLFEKFLDRYFPYRVPDEPTLSTAAEDAQGIVGSYDVSRHFETNILSFVSLLGQTNIAMDPKDKTILIQGLKGLNGQPTHYREVGPLLFRAVDGQEKIAFVKDSTGRMVAHIDFPFMVFKQVGNPLAKSGMNYFILGFSLITILVTLLLWPVGAMIRKHYGRKLPLDAAARRLRFFVHIICLLDVAIVLVFIIVFSGGLGKPEGLSAAAEFFLHIVQVLGLIAGIGALIAVYNGVKSWSDGNQWFWNKVWNTLIAFACVGFFWFLYYWHLLNFNMNY